LVVSGNRKFKGETQKPIDAGILIYPANQLLPSALELLLLLPEAQTFDYVSVTLNIILFDVIEKSSSLTNKLQQTAT
jgi:hypothetical protein